ncbi:MAG: LysR substrate-binding domain-containing protein [Rhodospirillaceae bacterium]|nr:LysR substrate-binding domain-containing protein [Rhodospirillaceae bacterium]
MSTRQIDGKTAEDRHRAPAMQPGPPTADRYFGRQCLSPHMRDRMLRRLKLHQLRMIVEVARHESITSAAKALNVSQPAVTKTVRDVEKMLGGALFERSARGVVLNEVGELLLPHIRTIFGELDRMGNAVQLYKSGGSGEVSIGVTMVALPVLLPACLSTFVNEVPNASVRVEEGTVDQLLAALDNGQIDLVIGRLLDSPRRTYLVHRQFLTDTFVPVVGARHPLATRKNGRRETLAKYRWILPPEGSSARQPLDRFLTAHGIRPKGTVIETVSFQMVLGLLDKTDMVAVVPRHIADHGVASGSLSMVGPDLDGGTLPVGITYRGDRNLNPLARRLAGFFEQIVASGAWNPHRNPA